MEVSHVWGTSFLAAGALLALGCPASDVGDPCIPEQEYLESFSGFAMNEANIESRSFQCRSRICLVNHFQGRVSCPAGQEQPVRCASDAECTPPEHCTDASVVAPACDPTACGTAGAQSGNCTEPDGTSPACGGRVCDAASGFCRCASNSDCPAIGDYVCELATGRCITRVCSAPNAPNRCYVPGSELPVSVSVCGQCGPEGHRDAAGSVYCSCRCGVAEGAPDDPDFNFCTCPAGFVCEEVRKNLGLGDPKISGKFCIREGSNYVDDTQCGVLPVGHVHPVGCRGIASP